MIEESTANAMLRRGARMNAVVQAQTLHCRAAEADRKFHEALVTAYGKKEAGTIRYQPSKQTPEIRALGDDYKNKIEAWRTAYCLSCDPRRRSRSMSQLAQDDLFPKLVEDLLTARTVMLWAVNHASGVDQRLFKQRLSEIEAHIKQARELIHV